MVIINKKICTLCGGCSAVCPHGVIFLKTDIVVILDHCVSCGKCVEFCPVQAISKEKTTSGLSLHMVKLL